jgi:hypothetical protein
MDVGYTMGAESAIFAAISSLQQRICQCPNEEQRQTLRELLNTCKFVSERLASLAWVPSEDDVRRYQSAGSQIIGPPMFRVGS